MNEMVDEDSSPNCPECGEPLPQPPAGQWVSRCEACGHESVFVLDDHQWSARADDSDDSRDDQVDVELDGLRIRHQTRLRRSLFRSRGFALFASFITAVLVVQAGSNLWDNFREHGPLFRRTIYIGWIILGLAIIVSFLVKARSAQQQINELATADPTTPPDFEPLSNGSQIADALEHTR